MILWRGRCRPWNCISFHFIGSTICVCAHTALCNRWPFSLGAHLHEIVWAFWTIPRLRTFVENRARAHQRHCIAVSNLFCYYKMCCPPNLHSFFFFRSRSRSIFIFNIQLIFFPHIFIATCKVCVCVSSIWLNRNRQQNRQQQQQQKRS